MMANKAYILKPISNGDRKKAAAAKHNMAYVESQAYAQDRIEDPEKYSRRVNTGSRRRIMGLMAATIATCGLQPYYID